MHRGSYTSPTEAVKPKRWLNSGHHEPPAVLHLCELTVGSHGCHWRRVWRPRSGPRVARASEHTQDGRSISVAARRRFTRAVSDDEPSYETDSSRGCMFYSRDVHLLGKPRAHCRLEMAMGGAYYANWRDPAHQRVDQSGVLSSEKLSHELEPISKAQVSAVMATRTLTSGLETWPQHSESSK